MLRKQDNADKKPFIEIPQEEQWRLIKESGVLKKAEIPANKKEQELEVTPLADEILNAAILIIPCSFLLLLMEILIHFQYSQNPSLDALVSRMVPGVPILSIFIFYTTRYKHHRRMQLFLFVLAFTVSSRLVYILSRASWLVNMRQCPPLATIWVYTIVQLDLGPAVLSLVVTGVFVWYKGLKLFK